MSNIYVVLIVDNDYGPDPEVTWHKSLDPALKEAQESHDSVIDSGGSINIYWFDPEENKSGYVKDWQLRPLHVEKQ